MSMNPFVLAAAALLLPGVALAAPQTFRDLIALFVLIINVATPVLVALALVLFLTRAVLTTSGVGGDKAKGFSAERFRTVALWSVLILFVMVSIWGILNLIENTFLGNDVGALEGADEAIGDDLEEFCDGLDEC